MLRLLIRPITTSPSDRVAAGGPSPNAVKHFLLVYPDAACKPLRYDFWLPLPLGEGGGEGRALERGFAS
jgi:hypothetical protein